MAAPPDPRDRPALDPETAPAELWREADGPARRLERLLAAVGGAGPVWPTVDDLRARPERAEP